MLVIIKKIIKNFLPYLFVFIISLYKVSDPDLGWHLKYGEYIFNNFSILRENTFSQMMPDFKWVNIAWGTDAISYAIFSNWGFLGLTLAGALITVLAFFFISKAYKLDFWDKVFVFPILLYFLSPIISTSFRGQTLSLTFIGALLFILSRFENKNNKSLYFLPLLFLIWANIHGLFILGMGILIIWQAFFLLSNYLKNKSPENLLTFSKQFALINALIFAATLVHPIGIGIYHDALLHFNDPLLKSVTEYLPPEELSLQWYNLYFTAIFASIGFMAYYINKKLVDKLPELGTFTVLFLLSLWVKRYSWAMYYMITPMITPIARFFKPKKEKNIFRFATIFFVIFTLFAIYIKGPYKQYKEMSWEVFCHQYNGCSPEGAEVLKDYYIEGKTMTMYNWGGWLIWNYPELKPSTDGRMHLWRDESGFSAFEYDYRIEQNLSDVDSSLYDVVFMANFKPVYNRLKELEDEGKWETVYEDNSAAIFVRANK